MRLPTRLVIRLGAFVVALWLVSVSLYWDSDYLLPWSVRWTAVAGIAFLTTRSGILRASAALERRFAAAERRPFLSVSVLALASFAISASLSRWVLEPFPHVPDGFSYLFQAQIIAKGRLFASAPPLPEFFNFAWVAVHDGRWFSIFPPGWPLILAAGVRLGVPALVNPLLGALSVIVIYHLATELFGRRHGLLCALFCVLSPFFLFMSAEFMSHTSALLFTALSTLCFVKAARRPSGMAWFAGSGVAAAVAFCIRPVDTLAVCAAQIAHGLWTHRSRRLFVGSLLSVLLLTCGMGVYLAYNRILVGTWFSSPLLLISPLNRMGFGRDIGYLWAFPSPGHDPWRAFLNLNHNAAVISQDLFGWPVTSLLFVLTLALFGRKDARHGLCAAMCAASVGIYALYWYHGVAFGARFYFTLLPYLLMLTVSGIQQIPEAFARWAPRHARVESLARQSVAFVALCFAFGWMVYMPKVSVIGPYRNHWGMNGSFFDYQRRLPLDKAIVFVSARSGLYYGPAFISNETPIGSGPVIYALDRGEAENLRLTALFPDRSVYRYSYEQEARAPWTPWFTSLVRRLRQVSE